MTSRRAFLASSTAGGLALSFGAGEGWGKPLPAAGRVAISETFTPTEWVDAFRQNNLNLHSADRAFWDAFVNTRAAAAGPVDDELRLLSLPAPGVEAFEPALARRLVPVINDRLAETVRESHGTVAGLASLSVFDPNAAHEADRAISRLGLSGLALGANRGMRLDNRQLWPIYEVAEATRSPIYLPASYTAAIGDAPYRALGRAGTLTGAAADSGEHAAQLIFGGVLDAFPRLKVVLSRMGDAMAHRYGRLVAAQDALGVRGGGPKRAVQAYFSQNIYLTMADLNSREALAFCNQVIGERRVVAMRDDGQPPIHAEADVRALTRVQPAQLIRIV